jgi:hypothetical protein
LTLFAILGITFVLYADAEATSARIAREAENQLRADMDPQQALAFALGQLIYDVPDTQVGSGLRGHSLARTMYGINYTALGVPTDINFIPFNGVGRLHYQNTLGVWTPQPGAASPPDDYTLVNYTWFPSLEGATAGHNGFFNPATSLVGIRDPERFPSTAYRTSPTAAQTNPYVGVNVPYTYPDLNNFFLAAVKADGTLLSPSFFRSWLPFGPLDPSNPNWYVSSTVNPMLKYMVLRPRPADHPPVTDAAGNILKPGFPPPEDARGDVKNLTWAPGGNDSIWIDIGAPVMTAPDGTKYKMLVAPLILDLDGRINLNMAGNILSNTWAANGNSSSSASLPHLSNQGWGPWEVSLAKVLYGNSTIGVASTGSNIITNTVTTNLNVGDIATVLQPPTNPTSVFSSPITSLTANTITLAQPWPNGNGAVNVIDQEWMHLFTGRNYLGGTQTVPGKYVQSTNTPTRNNIYSNTPGSNVSLAYLGVPGIAPGGTFPHFYAPVDGNGVNESLNSSAIPSTRIAPPSGANCFPNIVSSVYLNGGSNGLPAPNTVIENLNHPQLFNRLRTPYVGCFAVQGSSTITMASTTGFNVGDTIVATQPNPPNPPNVFINSITAVTTTSITVSNPWIYATAPAAITDLSFPMTRAFRISEMEPLLRPNLLNQTFDPGSPPLLSDLIRLCPMNFGPSATNQRFGNLVTTHSMDLGSPGAIPNWYSTFNAGTATWTPAAAYGYPATGVTTGNPDMVPSGGAVTFPSFLAGSPVQPVTNSPGTSPPPFQTEFGTDWRAASAALGRIKLNRPLPPYPHMGSGMIPPYGSPIAGTAYGQSYGTLTAGTALSNQYQAAFLARVTLANDIYRRLLSLTGVTPAANPATPTNTELAPRRWLAQLAVNIVDYIDEDDISTPLPFYTQQDTTPGTSGPNFTTPTTPAVTQGGDDNLTATSPLNTGANPTYWVFGTELPKVILNEAFALANDPDPGSPQTGDNVNVWLELYNTMQVPAAGSNVQTTDGNRIPLYMTLPGGGGYSPYRVTLTNGLMPNQPPATAPLPDATCNVLGKAIPPTAATQPLPQSTTDTDFSTTPKTISNGNQAAGTPATLTGAGIDPGNFLLIGPSAANYPEPFPPATSPAPLSNVPVVRTATMQYATTNWWTGASMTDERTVGLTVLLRRLANPYLPAQLNPSLPNYNPYITADYLQNVPVRANGNAAFDTPPFNSRGKCQPYAALTILNGGNVRTLQPYSPVFDQQSNTPINNVNNTFGLQNNPLPPSGNYDWLVHLDRQVISPLELLHVSGYQPYQLTQRFMQGSNNLITTNATNPPNATNVANMFGHYVPWLDAIQNANANANLTAPWWYDYATGVATAGSTTVTMSNTAGLTMGDSITLIQFNPTTGLTTSTNTISTVTPNTSITLGTAWPATSTTGTVIIFDTTTGATNNLATQSHRLYRLFEFLECGDRAYGVDGLGRKPGLVNINTVWDPEPLQAIIDANPSIGITSLPPQSPPVNTSDPIISVFQNLLNSRTPSNATATPLSAIDRPFLPLSIGFDLGTSTAPALKQYPNNGTRVTQDTLLRLANQTAGTTTPQTFLFQNPTDGSSVTATTSVPHPYLQTQILNKLYNNVTTRSNVFAVWLTVGFFEVNDPTTVPPSLGAEIGRSEGRQVRHRMFAIVDRTNLNVFSTQFASVVTAGNPPPVVPQAILIPSPTNQSTAAPQTVTVQLVIPPITINPFTGMSWTLQAGMSVVFDPSTDNEETVVLQAPPAGAGPGQFQATFYKSHLPGATVMQRGNPGPWTTRYDPRLDPMVVPHYNIID